MEFGVTETGFNLKTFSDIIKDIESKYRARLQDNEYKLDFNTPEGIHSEAIAYELKELWEKLLELSNQKNLDTASGVYLDYFGTLLGIKRKAGDYATGQIKIVGNRNLVIPAGTIVKNAELSYELLSNVILDTLNNDEKYQGIGFIKALETGENYNINDNVIFETEYKGINKITNTSYINGGLTEEIDSLYRNRLKQKQQTQQTATHQALYNALKSLNEVNEVIILDPETEPATETGTIKIFIDGTPNDVIFETILNYKADGILTLEDENSISYKKYLIREDKFKRLIKYNVIKYSSLAIKVEVLETKNENEKDNRWSKNIKNEILNYINNLKTGESVSYVKTYSEILGIDDIRKIKLYMGLTADEMKEHEFNKIFNIPIGQRFRINENNIEVLYV